MSEQKENLALTEEELDTISEVLDSSKDETLDKINNTEENYTELEEDYATVSIDSETGFGKIDISNTSDEELLKNNESMKNVFGLTDEDMMQFLNVIKRYMNKEKFSVFNELPRKLQELCKGLCMANGVKPTRANMSSIAKNILIKEFIDNQKIGETFDEFEKELKETLDIPTMNDMYAESLLESMTVKLEENAKKIEDTNPEGAEKLRKVSSVYKETYTFNRLIEAVEYIGNKRLFKKLVKKYDTEIENFNAILSKCTIFKMPDVTSIHGILLRKFNEDESTSSFTTYDVILFEMAIYLTQLNYDLNDIFDAEWVYYTIRNIINLDFSVPGKSEFNDMLYNNIKDTIKKIHDIVFPETALLSAT